MSAEFPHLNPSQQQIAQLSKEERIAWIRQERWIQYPRAKRILERLSELGEQQKPGGLSCKLLQN